MDCLAVTNMCVRVRVHLHASMYVWCLSLCRLMWLNPKMLPRLELYIFGVCSRRIGIGAGGELMNGTHGGNN